MFGLVTGMPCGNKIIVELPGKKNYPEHETVQVIFSNLFYSNVLLNELIIIVKQFRGIYELY
jgi:hypothetical protein